MPEDSFVNLDWDSIFLVRYILGYRELENSKMDLGSQYKFSIMGLGQENGIN